MPVLQTVSFFSGCGFLDLGFEDAGFTSMFVNELDPEFMRAYQHSRRILGHQPPVHGYSTASIETFLGACELHHVMERGGPDNLTGFIGGPPCPDFSVGGKNRGRHGDHGRLTKIYFELIKQEQPDWFLFENVKGLWSTKRHKKFYNEQIASVQKAGYVTTDRLINSIEYGAPQDRSRVICIGFSKKLMTRMGLKTLEFPWLRHTHHSMDVLKLPWPTTNAFQNDVRRPHGIPAALTVQHWFTHNRVQTHPNADMHFTPRAGLAKFKVIAEGDDSRKSYKRLHRHRYSPTACYGNNEVHLHPTLPRRISIAEALAIQTLPANFSLPRDLTLSDGFKTVGNGVPYVAANGLARSISAFINENYP